jgi:molybdopterin converting factor small subunit
MSSVLDNPTAVQHLRPAQRLRTTMAAMRLSFTWFGTRKTLTQQQKSQAADAFGAEGDFLSAGKELVDTKHPAFRAVTAVRNWAISLFKGVSLPYPEPGIRLVKQDEIEKIDGQMAQLREELAEVVEGLNRHYGELKEAARQRLGSLYSEQDYPASLRDLFAMGWDFPSLEAPAYLAQLNPQLYEQECQRVQARFDEAVRLAEEAFTAELAKLVSHLTERLSGQEDGRPKIFRDGVLENLTGFFERFRALNVRSSEDLDREVADAQRIIRGVEPQDLRDNLGLRQHVATEMSRVQSVLDGLLVARPRRNILRRPK